MVALLLNLVLVGMDHVRHSLCFSLVCSFIYSSNFVRNALERKENENIESFSMESLFLLSV